MDKNITQILLQKWESELKGQKYPWKNAIDFFTNPKFVGAKLFPNQILLLKLWNLDLDLTDEEWKTLKRWEEGFANEDYRNGVSSNVEERIQYCKTMGAEWFPTIIAVMGRRAGKTFLTGLQLSYCLACYLWTDAFGLNTDKLGHEPNLTVMATSQSQMQGTIFTDLYRAVMTNPFFRPFLLSATQLQMNFATLPTQLKTEENRKNDIPFSPVSIGAHGVTSNSDSARGWAIPFFAFDEAFFAQGGESSRSGNEAIRALRPSLKQFYPHSMEIYPSSPRTRSGQLYSLYTQGLRSDVKNILICQMESWQMYTPCPEGMIPIIEAPDPNGDSNAQEQAQEERFDPIGYKREYRAQFVDSSFVYFDPDAVKRIFVLPAKQLMGQTTITYRMHCDPARVNDDFSVMVAHIENNIVKVDYYTVFRPSDFPNHTINYNTVVERLKGLMVAFHPAAVTFDQFNSASLVDQLNEHARALGMATRVYVETATKQKNNDMYQRLKMNINAGQVQSYTDDLNKVEKDRCLLEASLDMVQERETQIYKPHIPGYGHLDLVDCLAVLNMQLRNHAIQEQRKNWGVMGQLDPFRRSW